MSATNINYATVAHSIKQINQVFLQTGKGFLLRCKVDEKNDIVDAEIVMLQDALAGGFNPAEFVGKKNVPKPN
jgi:hypothetical protein